MRLPDKVLLNSLIELYGNEGPNDKKPKKSRKPPPPKPNHHRQLINVTNDSVSSNIDATVSSKEEKIQPDIVSGKAHFMAVPWSYDSYTKKFKIMGLRSC